MKYYLDTEFIENGKTIDLISIGIVSEDDRYYYAISNEFDESKASDWVKENVLAQIKEESHLYKKPRSLIKNEILGFVFDANYKSSDKPEFWAYYADYDWVCLCQLFGTMMDLPKGFPMYCKDIKQLCDHLGNPQLPKQENGNHNALSDAKHNKVMWQFLKDLSKSFSNSAFTLDI